MDTDKLLKQISQERSYSFNYIDGKKTKRRKDLENYLKEAETNKINTNSVYVAIQTLMSIYWQNKITVKWQGRDRFDKERARDTNKIAKFDYKEMGISELDYVLEFYRFNLGVGVQVSDGFDKTIMCPKIMNIHPLSCFPDPDGGPTIKTHRFFGFEVNMSVEEMKKMGFNSNIDKLDGLSDNETLNKQTTLNNRGYANDIDYTKNKLHTVYFHFCRHNGGTPYIVATNPGVSYTLKVTELLPVMKEEKLDKSKIYFPIALKYYSYIPGDFFSVSVHDLLGDKQTIYGKLFNAMISMAIRNAYGDDRFVDINKIKDLKGLQQPSLEGKIIPVDGKGEGISNAVYQIPKDNPGSVPFNVKQYIEEISTLEIGIDRNTSGVLSTQNSTLGEREMAQKNANIRFLLATRQGNWFEEFRWSYLWYRMYVANLKSIDEKMIYFNTAYSQVNYVFKRDDFIGVGDLRIEIINEAERQQEIEGKKADRMALLPQLIAGAKTETQKTLLYREMLEAQGEEEEYILNLFPLTSTEIQAFDKLEALNENDMRGTRIDSMDDDHEVYIQIFKMGDDTEAKEKAINLRYQAIAYNPQISMQENGALEAAQNTSSAQLTNSSIQQNKKVPSLNDITN